MTIKRQRMINSDSMLAVDPLSQAHFGEHDEDDLCHLTPVCTPVDPNAVMQNPDALPKAGEGEPPRKRSRYLYTEYHADNSPCNDTECDKRHWERVKETPMSAYRPPPSHYSTDAGITPWDVWDAFDLDRYSSGATKYIFRAGKKNIATRLEDLKKARDYINKAIEVEEQKNG